MPEFIFTSPSGEKFRVTAPEDATEAQAFQMLQSGQSAPAAQAAPQPLQTTKPLTFTENLVRQLGRTGRIGLTGFTGTGQMIGDFLTGAANLAGARMPGTNAPIPPVSQMFQEGLTRLGLPEAETTEEKVVDFLGTMAAGGVADPFMRAAQRGAASLSPKGFISPKDTAQLAAVKQLRSEGYNLPPSNLGAKAPYRVAQGLVGSEQTERLAQRINRPINVKLGRQELEFPYGTPLTKDTLVDHRKYLVQQGYDPIKAIQDIGVGSKFHKDMASIVAKYGGADDFPLAQRKGVKELVDKYLFYIDHQTGLRRYTRNYSGQGAIDEIIRLREEAAANLKRGGADEIAIGKVQKAIATALEDNIEYHLQRTKADPRLVNEFRYTRSQLAKNHAIEDMLVDPKTGIVDTRKAAEVAKNAKLTGGLEKLATAGSPVFSEATGPLGAGTPINWGDIGLYSSALGFAPMSGGVSLFGLGLPAMRSLGRHALLSDPMQNLMVRGLEHKGLSPATQRMLGAFPTPLFSQGEQ